ncbi:MAG: NAD(P)-dependent oxidoreductase [Lachnospiraceae bacterium]|nr:NAD(P)-dependent oxidoreductase [Lachnospiraceae bacterium]
MNYTQEYWDDVNSILDNIPQLKNIYGKSIFITGGTGMICSSVIDLLLYLNKKSNAKISIILGGRSLERTTKRFTGFAEGMDYKFVYYDATKEMDLDINVDYIIHGASNANPTVYSEEPVETMLANLIGLNGLLEYAVKNQVNRLLYISSSEIYGKKEENTPYKEDDYGFVDILNPRACYPNAKRAAETLCISYSEEYCMDTVIVRPGHIYGPSITESDSRASAQFTRDAVNGENIIMKSSGTQLRSYCYTLDCASAILTVLLNGESQNAYNISSENCIVSIRDMAEALANAANTKVIFENPSDIERKSYNLMSNSSLNGEKLQKLGWTAKFDIDQGTKKTVSLMRKEITNDF